MTYVYNGKRSAGTIYLPAYGHEAAAKFAYFRKAEAGINGGPSRFYAPPQALKPIRVRRAVPECGTNSGYARHIRLKEAPCRPCLDARGHYQRQHRAKKGRASGSH